MLILELELTRFKTLTRIASSVPTSWGPLFGSWILSSKGASRSYATTCPSAVKDLFDWVNTKATFQFNYTEFIHSKFVCQKMRLIPRIIKSHLWLGREGSKLLWIHYSLLLFLSCYFRKTVDSLTKWWVHLLNRWEVECIQHWLLSHIAHVRVSLLVIRELCVWFHHSTVLSIL